LPNVFIPCFPNADELYGDFEDLETGETFNGKEDEDEDDGEGEEQGSDGKIILVPPNCQVFMIT
jgi:hypothetical protein